MSELDELFDQASVVGGTADEDNEWLVVDHQFRSIDIPCEKKLLGVTSDEKVNTLNFKVPRYYMGNDLSEFEFRINYINAKGEGDIYDVTEKETDENYITFSWLVGRHACMYNGAVSFIICARTYRENTDPPVIDKEYNTAVHQLKVILGLEVGEEVYAANFDLIEQFLIAIKKRDASAAITIAARDEAVDILNQIKRMLFQISSINGVTFTVTDGADGIVVNDLIIKLDPRQTGSGTPSSSNVRPFIGTTSCMVERSGLDPDSTETVEANWAAQPGPVYYGYYDVINGILYEYPYYASYNGEELVGPWLSSMDEYAPGTTPTLGAEVIDQGATPRQYQLTPYPLTTLYEYNHFVTNGTGMELKYYTKYMSFRLA